MAKSYIDLKGGLAKRQSGNNEMNNGRSKAKGVLFLTVLIVVTAVFRIYGAIHSTPIPYPSEANVMNSVNYMTENVTLETEFYAHPDQPLLYASLIGTNAFELITRGKTVSGPVSMVAKNYISGHPGSDYFAKNISRTLKSGRCVNVMFSLVVILLFFMIGNRVKPRFGWLAALFAALFPSYNMWSGFLLSDTGLTMFMLTAVLFSVCYIQTENNIYTVLTTISCALATTQKYPGLLSVVLVVYCVLYKNRALIGKKKHFVRAVIWDGLKLTGIFAVAVIVAAPSLVIHFPYVINAFIAESGDVHLGADGLGYFGNMWFYIKVFINQAGLVPIAAAAVGIYFIIKNKIMKEIAPIFLGWFMCIVLCKLGLHWERWSLMFHSTTIILSAYGIIEIFKLSASTRLYRITAVCAAVFTVFVMSSNSFVEFLCRIGDDTRVVGASQIEQLGINRENTYTDQYTILHPALISINDNNVQNDKDESAKAYDADEYKKYDYVMVSSYQYDRYDRAGERYLEQKDYYNDLRTNYEKVYEIKPWNPNRILMDQTTYGDFNLKLGVFQIVDNIKDIRSYYTDDGEKYFGPTVIIYKK